MAKIKNSPIHNMRLVIYAILTFIAILVIAIISISTQNKSLTLNSSASECPASPPRYNISTLCEKLGSGLHSKVQFTCRTGERPHVLSAAAVSRGSGNSDGQTCLPESGFTEAINKVCKCNSGMGSGNDVPGGQPVSGQRCFGTMACVSTSDCQGQQECDSVTHCCRAKNRVIQPTPTPGPNQSCFKLLDCVNRTGKIAGCPGRQICNTETHCCERNR